MHFKPVELDPTPTPVAARAGVREMAAGGAAPAPVPPPEDVPEGPADTVGAMLRAERATAGATRTAPAPRPQRRVLSAEEASSLAVQALERGRQRTDPSPAQAVATTAGPGTPASVVGELPENWWRFAHPDDAPSASGSTGWWGSVRRFIGRLFRWLA